jgi:hypothetical protein
MTTRATYVFEFGPMELAFERFVRTEDLTGYHEVGGI